MTITTQDKSLLIMAALSFCPGIGAACSIITLLGALYEATTCDWKMFFISLTLGSTACYIWS
ncbi:hypothetical protein [Halodesulfovibrio sp.]|jgi:hypothetical protein|uniref:hypothetical protein n=1 Tax=Halodesulfovibrio sp. TaxID=1912772 RepID=UPI0025DA069E|nr:hypothetical protein [Halodesulfovibrio sp.]MCT4625637.1 hypothetical protein [Halodesulfovibrio sp.]